MRYHKIIIKVCLKANKEPWVTRFWLQHIGLV